MTQDLTVGLLVKDLVHNANFSDLYRELKSFHQKSEVGDRLLELNFLKSKSLNKLLLAQEILDRLDCF